MEGQSQDIIQEIRSAEQKAKDIIERAEAERTKAVLEAETAAKQRLEQLRKELQVQLEQGIRDAEKAAQETFQQIIRATEKEATVLANLPAEWLREARDLLVQKVLEKWQ